MKRVISWGYGKFWMPGLKILPSYSPFQDETLWLWSWDQGYGDWDQFPLLQHWCRGEQHRSVWVSQQLLISSYLAGNSQRAAAVGWLEMPRYQVSEEKSQTCLRWQKVSKNSPGGYDLRHAEGNLATQKTCHRRTTKMKPHQRTQEDWKSPSGIMGHNSSSSISLLFIWSGWDINNMKVLIHLALCQ